MTQCYSFNTLIKEFKIKASLPPFLIIFAVPLNIQIRLSDKISTSKHNVKTRNHKKKLEKKTSKVIFLFWNRQMLYRRFGSILCCSPLLLSLGLLDQIGRGQTEQLPALDTDTVETLRVGVGDHGHWQIAVPAWLSSSVRLELYQNLRKVNFFLSRITQGRRGEIYGISNYFGEGIKFIE